VCSWILNIIDFLGGGSLLLELEVNRKVGKISTASSKLIHNLVAGKIPPPQTQAQNRHTSIES
jgi:hypothetical protein